MYGIASLVVMVGFVFIWAIKATNFSYLAWRVSSLSRMSSASCVAKLSIVTIPSPLPFCSHQHLGQPRPRQVPGPSQPVPSLSWPSASKFYSTSPKTRSPIWLDNPRSSVTSEASPPKQLDPFSCHPPLGIRIAMAHALLYFWWTLSTYCMMKIW